MQFLLRIENINQEEELKKLQEQDKYKDRLLATVSHDLRTPLNAITYLINNSKENKNKYERIKELDMALANSDLLMSLINDILDYCQMKDHKLRLNIENFNLKDFINSIANLMKMQTDLKGINFRIKNAVGNIELLSDIRRLKQILINLLSNAIKFTEKGFISLKVTTSLNLSNQLIFSVQDTGPGIQPEVVNQLGQPYATFGAGNNANIGGIGLGLNLCKQLIGLLGPISSFDVQTTIDVGTTFSFVIYTNLLSNNNKNEEDLNNYFNSISQYNFQSEDISQDSEISKNSIFSNSFQVRKSSDINADCQCENNQINQYLFTILIVDDNVFNLFVLEKQLKKISSNWHILKANNGQQAIQIFANYNNQANENNISLIIMDCEMPIMDGYTASKVIKLKIQNENYISSQIIGYTALLGINEEQNCLASGMNDVMIKPAQFSLLKQKVIRNLEEWEQQQQQLIVSQ